MRTNAIRPNSNVRTRYGYDGFAKCQRLRLTNFHKNTNNLGQTQFPTQFPMGFSTRFYETATVFPIQVQEKFSITNPDAKPSSKRPNGQNGTKGSAEPKKPSTFDKLRKKIASEFSSNIIPMAANFDNDDNNSTRISARILADSRNAAGNRIVTFELKYPHSLHRNMVSWQTLSFCEVPHMDCNQYTEFDSHRPIRVICTGMVQNFQHFLNYGPNFSHPNIINMMRGAMLSKLEQSKPKKLAINQFHLPCFDKEIMHLLQNFNYTNFLLTTPSSGNFLPKVSAGLMWMPNNSRHENTIGNALHYHDELYKKKSKLFEHIARPLTEEEAENFCKREKSPITDCTNINSGYWCGNLNNWVPYSEFAYINDRNMSFPGNMAYDEEYGENNEFDEYDDYPTDDHHYHYMMMGWNSRIRK